MQIQRALNSDIVMQFDECTAHNAPTKYVAASVERTARWARRCRDVKLAGHQHAVRHRAGRRVLDDCASKRAPLHALGFAGTPSVA